MGETNSVLIDVAGQVGLQHEAGLLRAISATALKWRNLAGQAQGFPSAVALIQALVEAPADPSLAKAFEDLGAADELATLRTGAAALNSLMDRIPDGLSKLLESVGSFSEQGGTNKDRGLVVLPIIDRTASLGKAKSGHTASFSFSLGAKADVTLEAGDTWPYSDLLPGPLLRIALAGGLNPEGTATLPFSGGSIKAVVAAEARCALEYYFALADPQQLYVLAAGERLGKLANPFDFKSVWDAFNTGDLAGLHYTFTGSTAANVTVSIADAGALSGGIKADLAATVAISIDLTGRYFLSLRAGPQNAMGQRQLIVTLSRERGSETSLAASLGATVDLGVLAKRVHAILFRALGEWDEALATLKPFLSPGTWLQANAGALIAQQARRLVDDDHLGAALARDLQGVIGIDVPDRPELVAWVQGRLEGVLDIASGWAEDQVGAVAQAADAFARALPAFAQPEARQILTEVTGDLVEHVATSLKEEVQAIFASKAEGLGRALKRLCATSSKSVESADAALDGVRQLIARYDALFRKVVKATEDAARAKVSVALQIEEGASSSAKVEIAGTFLARSDRSASIFRSITMGKLAALVELLDEHTGSPDFALDRERSSFLRFSGRNSRFGIDVVLLGFGVTGTDLLSAEASVLVDGNGKVQVDTRASLQRRFEALDAGRQIELLSSFSLVRSRQRTNADAPTDTDRSIGLAVIMGHLDQGLKRHEVERFVTSLVDSRLSPPSALPLAQATFTRWAGNPGSNGKISGVLQLKLALDRQSLSRILGLDAAPSGALSAARRQLIVRTAFQSLQKEGSSEAEEIAATVTFLAKRSPNLTLDELLANPAKTRRLLTEQVTGSLIPSVAGRYEAFVDASRMSNGMADMVAELRSIYLSTPEDRPDGSPLTWSAKDYRASERRAVRAVQEWLQLNNVLFWTNSKVHRKTIAFFETLAELAALDPTTSTSLIIWRRDLDADPETIVLSAVR